MIAIKSRRNLFLAAASWMMLPLSSFAAKNQDGANQATPSTQTDTSAIKPYETIVPTVAGDDSVVRVLFAYDCPFCRLYHNGLMAWGETLPKPLRIEFTPVISSSSENVLLAVYGRLIMQALAPIKIKQYDYSMYIQLQGDSDIGQIPKVKISPEDVVRVISAASGISVKKITEYILKNGSAIERKLPAYVKIIDMYKLKSTPSVAISGRILVTPDSAGGDPQKFLMLLNGLVSKRIQGGFNAL